MLIFHSEQELPKGKIISQGKEIWRLKVEEGRGSWGQGINE